jgi:hypothetical protein
MLFGMKLPKCCIVTKSKSSTRRVAAWRARKKNKGWRHFQVYCPEDCFNYLTKALYEYKRAASLKKSKVSLAYCIEQGK